MTKPLPVGVVSFTVIHSVATGLEQAATSISRCEIATSCVLSPVLARIIACQCILTYTNGTLLITARLGRLWGSVKAGTWEPAMVSSLREARIHGIDNSAASIAAFHASALPSRVAQRLGRRSCGHNLASDCSVLSTA